MTLNKFGLACAFGLISNTLVADDSSINLTRFHEPETALRLEVRQAPLAQVLDKISHTTGMLIHYSVLPEGRITATCVGATPKHILECLLKFKADLIFKSHHKTVISTSNGNIDEAWILGAKFDAISPSVISAECEATVLQQQEQLLALRAKKKEAQTEEAKQIDALIQMAQSKNPEDRAQGIGGLLAAGKPGDPTIKAALEAALSDKDANVRAQAISSFAHREGEGAEDALQAAMQDSSVDVRVMAVDSAGNNTAILQQGLLDKDETVRSLAALKLETLRSEKSQ